MALKMPKLFGEPKAKLATADGTIDVPTTQVRMTPSSSSGYDPLASVSVMEQLRAATAKSVAPWKLNIPDFVKLDLKAKRIQTTATSNEKRETPLQTVQRANGTISIQGSQGERLFSWLISEASGEGTLSVAAQGQGVTVFTVCTAVDKL